MKWKWRIMSIRYMYVCNTCIAKFKQVQIEVKDFMRVIYVGTPSGSRITEQPHHIISPHCCNNQLAIIDFVCVMYAKWNENDI